MHLQNKVNNFYKTCIIFRNNSCITFVYLVEKRSKNNNMLVFKKEKD